MSSTRVAVVTGANKGLGFGIVRALCKQFDGDVILTARDVERGTAAATSLQNENLHPKFHQLDVTDSESVVRLRDYLKENYNGLDLLVNNAAVFIDIWSKEPLSTFALETVKINYRGQVSVSEHLFPLLRPHARVVNMSSGMAYRSLSNCSEAIKSRFFNPDITIEELSTLMEEFVQSAESGQTKEQGFDDNAYGMSKAGLSTLNYIQQRELDKQGSDDIVVNCCSPGYVNTDMTLGKGSLSVEDGITTPVHLCLLAHNIASPRGEMVREMRIVDWRTGTPRS